MNRRDLLALVGATMAWPQFGHAAAEPPAPPRKLHLVNAHTGESFEGFYRNEAGPIPTVMHELSVFLRDFHCGARVPYDVAALDFLAAVMDAAGQKSATVLSAYRTPETNGLLARTTFGVAEHSQHMYGRALDVHFESNLGEAMRAARAMRRGGVGWYPHSGFIHLDSGPVRNWDLDEGGLENLLISGHYLRFNRQGELVVGSAEDRRTVFVARRGKAPTVRERLARLRALARAEYMHRRH
jgi:uncharacterized protein YcbK (DUF882 family)